MTASTELTDDQLPYLVDGWGTPLVFCRWPTGDANGVSGANPRQASTKALDPADPQGLLMANWSKRWKFTDGEKDKSGNYIQWPVHALPAPVAPGNTYRSVRLTPTIVWRGPDKQFGFASLTTLQLDADATKASLANDNLYSEEVK